MANSNIPKGFKEKAQEAFSDLYTNGYTWDQIQTMINNAIQTINSNSGRPLSIFPKSYQRGWQNYIQGTGGKRMSPDNWKDLWKVYENISGDHKDHTKPPGINRVDSFKYYTPKFQDTILPFIYQHSYTAVLPVKFDIDKDWNEITDTFQFKDDQVAIHNLPSALAIARRDNSNSTMFFFPLFIFKGYGMVIRKSTLELFCTDNNLISQPYCKLNPELKLKFLEQSSVVLEPKTDVEWVYKNYYKKLKGANWDKIKIEAFDVNEGKQRFAKGNIGDIYCTNVIHLTHLGKDLEKYEIITGENYTKYKNVNGLLCTMDFFNKNTDVISDLIKLWYKNINDFLKEKEEIIYTTSREEENDGFKNFHFAKLTDSLNQYTNSNLTLKELMISYKANNEFSTKAVEAFNELFTPDFVSALLTNKSFWEISGIQLGVENENNMKEIIERLYNEMKTSFEKINN